MSALLPAYPGALLFVGGLNLLLVRHLPADVRAALEGKTLRIGVTDLGVTFDFGWRAQRFVPKRASVDPDLTIAASAADFWLLAQRREDPDTLFFNRRLVMEGDTELGLMVKNTLDGIDLSQYAPERMLARWRQVLKR
ncbi:MAG: SCP2 sterol-binding domain-containing protein [Pseudomonadota bacterium]